MKLYFYSIASALILNFSPQIEGCTDFLLETKDGAYINGRSMEFAIDLQTTFRIHARNENLSSKAPNGSKGIQWTSKYGYISATAFGKPLVVDGLNEAGLSFGALWLPKTQYQNIETDESDKALDFAYFGDWVLGNFSTIAEVKEALKEIRVWGHPVAPLKDTPPLHISLHDATGNSLVIEFINGEMKIYDNPIGVLTNYPPFDWQLINLQNYIKLTGVNAEPITIGGVVIGQTGQGSGLLGIPGDWTPPSRFVRITTLKRFALQASTAEEGVNLVCHLLNNVDIPLGTIRNKENDIKPGDYTQWIVIKDLTNQVVYFRSYQGLNLKAINLKKLDFSTPSVKTIPINTGKDYIDITATLKSE